MNSVSAREQLDEIWISDPPAHVLRKKRIIVDNLEALDIDNLTVMCGLGRCTIVRPEGVNLRLPTRGAENSFLSDYITEFVLEVVEIYSAKPIGHVTVSLMPEAVLVSRIVAQFA